MICELCGKEVPVTKPVFIERSRLNVCPNCAKFGDENRGSKSASAMAPSAQVIDQRLQKRERRMQTKDIYASADTVHVIDDYGTEIRKARVVLGMDLEQFAASIGEKKGILSKVETNDLLPDDKLVKKLEKALGITLTETVSGVGSKIGGSSGGSMTLENFIKKK